MGVYTVVVLRFAEQKITMIIALNTDRENVFGVLLLINDKELIITLC
jgi:hypothetical protein